MIESPPKEEPSWLEKPITGMPSVEALAERVVVLSCQVSKGTCTSSYEHVEQHIIR